MPIIQMTTYKINTPGPTPPEPWTPGANTIAYWKLDGDLTDEMGNYNGTNVGNSVSYVALPGDSNIQCAQVNSGSWRNGISLPSSIGTALLTSNSDFTFGGFIKTTNGGTEMLYIDGNNRVEFTISIRGPYYINLTSTPTYWFYPDSNTNVIDSNTWYSVVVTYSSAGIWTYYVNGVSLGSTLNRPYTTLTTSGRTYLARLNSNTLMSNMVLESSTWTQQDVETFHNAFKSLYLIS